LLTKLEWAWGLQPDHIRVDTHRNICFLRSDWHDLFDRGCWLLLPSQDIVEDLLAHSKEHRDRPIHEVYGDKKMFDYRLVPLTKNIDNIFRYNWPETVTTEQSFTASRPSSGSVSVDTLDFTRHCYPFRTLPTLRSHVQPHFAIYNFGIKYSHSQVPALGIAHIAYIVAKVLGISEDDAQLLTLRLGRLYELWINAKPPSNFHSYSDDRSPSTSSSEQGDDSSNRRSRSSRKRSRRLPRIPGSKQQDKFPASRRSMAVTPELENDDADAITSYGSSDMQDIQLDREQHIYDAAVLSWASHASDAAASAGGWESLLVNDGQLGRYTKELVPKLPCFRNVGTVSKTKGKV